ncbi:MAG TPA: GNAT family N-acetyltransferase [Thermoplasmata archaeon]|nr:GNAT family N-acetyltransferase [Thermoplasmata archaeon]
MTIPEPRPATEVRPDLLLELVHSVRATLVARGESIASSWVEEAAQDLKAGRQAGWVVGTEAIAFATARGARLFGHVHVEGTDDRVERAETLLAVLITRLDAKVPRLEGGVSGLTEEEEAALADRFVRVPGAALLLRARMERIVPPALVGSSLPDPPGIERVGVRSVPLGALAELDWRSFAGTPDQNLVADTLAEEQQSVADMLAGRIGRFLDEASTALLTPSGQLVGAVLTSEHDPRTAVLLDLLVEPTERRKGLGRFLVLWTLRAMTALGYSTARLWVTETNRAAWSLYVSLGFEVTGRARLYRYVLPPATVPAQPQTAR